MKPEAAVPRLTLLLILASFARHHDLSTSDGEMLKPAWIDDDFAHEVMRYTLTKAELVARREMASTVCIEPHGVVTKTAAGLRRIVELVPLPHIGVNWDTGNSFLAGLEILRRARVGRRPVHHVHAKDISLDRAERDRGRGHRHPGRLRLR